VVETHQRRVVFPGRQQAIVGIQLGLNLGAQRLAFASSTPMTLTRQKVPIVLPSSTVAVDAGSREWWLNRSQSSTQAPNSAARKKSYPLIEAPLARATRVHQRG
jgi:hypothetical protein